ncbi:hypothetical protein Tco_0015407 [Tanacetum coccineum]
MVNRGPKTDLVQNTGLRTVSKEINNFQQELNETLYPAWERFNDEVSSTLFDQDTGTADAKTTIQEITEYSQKWHNGTSRGRSTETSDRLSSIQAQLNNLGREIKKVNEKVYAAQVGCEQCKGPHYTKDCPLKEEGKTLEEAYYTQFGGPFQGGGYRATAPGFYQRNNPENQVKSISTTIEADSHSIRRIGSSQYAVFTRQYSKSRQTTVPFLSRLDNHYCKEEEENYGPKFMKAYGASHINNVIPRKEKDLGSFTLPCFINNVCFDNAPVDLGASALDPRRPIFDYPPVRARLDVYNKEEEARLMGETLVLNRSLDPFLEDYIELNDLNEPFELRRNQGDDLIPTIEEDFLVLENMEDYRDKGMGDVIFGDPFLREVRVKARLFEGMITLTQSEKYEKNGISHAYQKLKGFYKGVLNLGPDYIRNAKTEE